ncbi:unnamed protein product, partial [Prorocentrum cordatum]
IWARTSPPNVAPAAHGRPRRPRRGRGLQATALGRRVAGRLPARGAARAAAAQRGVLGAEAARAARCAVGERPAGLRHVARRQERVPDLELARALMALIWAEVAVAWASCACVLFVEAGQVRRGPGTCYPIPPAVAQQLRTRASGSVRGLRNVAGPGGSSYCVRCLVWRPEVDRPARNHHCGVCQRCYSGFDHHCCVLGRCIVAGNRGRKESEGHGQN